MKFSSWLKLRIRDWLMDDSGSAISDTHSTEESYPIAIRNDCSRINFDVFPAEGGYAIQIRYSETNKKHSDDNVYKIYIVSDYDSLGAKIQEIFCMESLRRC